MNVPTPGFTGVALDRADSLRLAADRIAELAAAAEARLMRLAGVTPLLDDEGRLRWDSPAGRQPPSELLFLGMAGDAPVFAPLSKTVDAARSARDMFGLLAIMQAEDAALWGIAHSLIAWHGKHGFCSNCGTATVPFRAGWGRRCAGCGIEHYPRVDPVVIMLAEHRDRVLVGRQPGFPPHFYSALAGFVEPGESIEEAVRRELKEEAGVDSSAVRYVASQPWPFPSQLMIACIAAVASDRLVLDAEELEDAIWVDRTEVREALEGQERARFAAPPRFAIAHTLLSHWTACG